MARPEPQPGHFSPVHVLTGHPGPRNAAAAAPINKPSPASRGSDEAGRNFTSGKRGQATQ